MAEWKSEKEKKKEKMSKSFELCKTVNYGNWSITDYFHFSFILWLPHHQWEDGIGSVPIRKLDLALWILYNQKWLMSVSEHQSIVDQSSWTINIMRHNRETISNPSVSVRFEFTSNQHRYFNTMFVPNGSCCNIAHYHGSCDRCVW